MTAQTHPIPSAAHAAARAIGQPKAAKEIARIVEQWRQASKGAQK